MSHGAYHKIETILMKRTLLFLLAFTGFAIALQAEPTPKHRSKRNSSKHESRERFSGNLAESANGWNYVNGEWIHPDGYKYVRGQVLRTTAKAGRAAPEPPGKLAQENARKLAPNATLAPDNVKTAAEKAAEERRRNLTPTAAPQTGSHL